MVHGLSLISSGSEDFLMRAAVFHSAAYVGVLGQFLVCWILQNGDDLLSNIPY
jgi:putative flippase GtrA